MLRNSDILRENETITRFISTAIVTDSVTKNGVKVVALTIVAVMVAGPAISGDASGTIARSMSDWLFCAWKNTPLLSAVNPIKLSTIPPAIIKALVFI